MEINQHVISVSSSTSERRTTHDTPSLLERTSHIETHKTHLIESHQSPSFVNCSKCEVLTDRKEQ